MNSKIKTIIIEDELPAQQYLASLLEKNFDILTVDGYATNNKDAIDLIHKVKPEVVFMDIKLDDGLSFSIFEQVDNYDFEVIFVTGLEDQMKNALNHFALAYILKPIDEELLKKSVRRYITKKERLFNLRKLQSLNNFIDQNHARILLHTGAEHISVNLKDIVKCQADGNYTHFFLSNGQTHLVSKNLKYYEHLLETKGFFKAHRSLLLNISFIKSIYKKEYIKLENGEVVQVSIRNKHKLIALISLLS